MCICVRGANVNIRPRVGLRPSFMKSETSESLMAGVWRPLASVCVVLCRMAEVGHMYKQCAELTDVVNPIKDVNRKYRQVSGTSTALLHP